MHNEIGAHNASFYKMLDELWEEAENLMDKGITGNNQNGAGAAGFSFTGASRNLDPSRHNVSRDQARRIALAAAERRSQSQSQRAPQVLGGACVRATFHSCILSFFLPCVHFIRIVVAHLLSIAVISKYLVCVRFPERPISFFLFFLLTCVRIYRMWIYTSKETRHG